MTAVRAALQIDVGQTGRELTKATGLAPRQVTLALRALRKDGGARCEGKTRGTRWFLVGVRAPRAINGVPVEPIPNEAARAAAHANQLREMSR